MNQDEIINTLHFTQDVLEWIGLLNDELIGCLHVSDCHGFKKVEIKEHQGRRLHNFASMIDYFVNDAWNQTFEFIKKEVNEGN